MARRVRVIWVLISGLSLLLLALFVTKQESEQVETEKQSGNKLRNELPAPAVDGREASPTAPLRLPLRGRHVQVCSETGQPLANAVIHGTESDSRRWYPIEDLSFIGKTDSAGLLALNDATPPYLIASLAGFVPTGTKVLDDPDAVTTIVLQASCRASYLCTTRDGRPVPGVAIQVSLSPLDRRERLRHNSQLLPGGNPATAVYWVTTDASGQAQMSDVPVGVCHIAVGHTDLHYALVSGLPAGDFRLGPGINSFHFKFDPVWASWVEVVGDKLEDWRASYPEALWVPPLAVVDLGLRSQAMRGTGANIVAMLCCPTYSESAGYSEPPRETEVRLLLSERGWLVRKVPMRPIAEWRAPEQLLLGGGEPRAPMGSVMVNVLRPDGSIAPIGPVFIRSKTGHPYEYEIASGKSIRLPTGKYLVASSSPFVSNALLKETLELTVEDGKEVVHACRLAYDLIPLRLDLQDDAGLSINSATIRLYGIEHNEQAHFAFGLSDYTFWVPSGTLRIEVFVSGYAKKELRASIPGVSGDPIVIRGVLSRL